MVLDLRTGTTPGDEPQTMLRGLPLFVLVDSDGCPAVPIGETAIHAIGIERHRYPAATINGDYSAFTTHSYQAVHQDKVSCLTNCHAAILDAGTDVMGHGSTNKVLTMTRRRHRATRFIARIGAGADDRRVTKTTPAFIRHAAGRCAGRQLALAVERDGANRSHA